MDKDLYIKKCWDAPEMSVEMAKEAAAVASHPFFRSLIREVLVEVETSGAAMLDVDLTSDAGVREGLKVQGRSTGLSRAVDIILETIERAEENNDA